MTVKTASALYFTGKIHDGGRVEAVLSDPAKIAAMHENILAGDAYVFRKFVTGEWTKSVREYLAGIGRGSLPNYQAIDRGTPNFHRINRADERAYIEGVFHQFCFFPWNQDVFDFFRVFRPAYELKNLVANYRRDQFLGRVPEEDCTTRLAFQFYPCGSGVLHKHRDSLEGHQGALPILILSQKGRDFKTGGAYFEKADGTRFCVDDYADDGDLIYYNPQVPHGVDKIDPGAGEHWLSFKGRWMLLVAVNKLSYNTKLMNSVDLEKKK